MTCFLALIAKGSKFGIDSNVREWAFGEWVLSQRWWCSWIWSSAPHNYAPEEVARGSPVSLNGSGKFLTSFDGKEFAVTLLHLTGICWYPPEDHFAIPEPTPGTLTARTSVSVNHSDNLLSATAVRSLLHRRNWSLPTCFVPLTSISMGIHLQFVHYSFSFI